MRTMSILAVAACLAGCAEFTEPLSPVDERMAAPSPLLSANASGDAFSQPFSQSVWIPCANGGAGESVDLAGTIEFRSHVTQDAAGGVHLSTHVRPSAVTGLGASSGARYKGTGGAFQGEHYAADGYPATYQFVNNFRIIGQGRDNNLLVHAVVHLTVNANGDQTAWVDLSSNECR